jgi:phage-related protein
MAETAVRLFRESSGDVPFLTWFESLPERAQDKCRVRLERLQEKGNELRRPEADFLRDGIYELRVKHLRMNYRILYFFAGQSVAVVSHGLQKEKVVPANEIDRAIERKRLYSMDPIAHTMTEDLS